MATDVLVEQKETQNASDGRQEITIESGRLGNDFFGIETKEEENPSAVVQPEEKPAEQKVEIKPEEKQVIEVAKTWHKDYGWETEEAAKSEIEQLRKLKDQKPEYKFENDESKRLAEAISKGDRKTVLNILETQERLESLTTTDVNDNTAEAIIKLAMQLKSKANGVELSEKEINYKFNKDYGIPKEPVIKDDELEDEFNARKLEWQEKVDDIKMARAIEAKLAKPELEKLKTQIVLPNISENVQQKPPTQEELDAAKKYDNDYVQSVDNSIKNFNGVTIPVKNEVVDFPVSFGVTDEEKVTLSTLMKDFQKSNYDTNGLFADLWVNDDKTLKTDKMIEDYYFIKNKEKMLSKLTNDSATKAVESYIKGKKNINVNETAQQGTAQINNEDKTEMDVIRDQFFG